MSKKPAPPAKTSAKSAASAPAGKKKKKSSTAAKLLLSAFLLAAVILLPSSMLLVVGMLPSLISGFVVRANKKNKTTTIAAMNLAGCAPFLLDLWMAGHSFEKSIDIITDPMAIIVMYSAAAVGYLVFWSTTGVVSAALYQKGTSQRDEMKKRQKELIERWGKEVTGEIKLNEHGFPVEEEKISKDN